MDSPARRLGCSGKTLCKQTKIYLIWDQALHWEKGLWHSSWWSIYKISPTNWATKIRHHSQQVAQTLSASYTACPHIFLCGPANTMNLITWRDLRLPNNFANLSWGLSWLKRMQGTSGFSQYHHLRYLKEFVRVNYAHLTAPLSPLLHETMLTFKISSLASLLTPHR